MKTCSEKALEWNVTPRTVNAMCKNGRIQGAVKEKRTWLIPDDAEKPLDGRISTGKYSRKKTGKEKTENCLHFRQTRRSGLFFIRRKPQETKNIFTAIKVF